MFQSTWNWPRPPDPSASSIIYIMRIAYEARDLQIRNVIPCRIRRVQRESPVAANWLFAPLRAFFGWAKVRKLIKASSCEGMPRKEKAANPCWNLASFGASGGGEALDPALSPRKERSRARSRPSRSSPPCPTSVPSGFCRAKTETGGRKSSLSSRLAGCVAGVEACATAYYWARVMN
jgi:hypothetical protein